MKTMAERIEERLTERFAPVSCIVTDDSAKHAGHAGAREGGESHFSVKIVSAAFEGMNRVARHRAVYATLTSFFEAGLHAMAIDAKTPSEVQPR